MPVPGESPLPVEGEPTVPLGVRVLGLAFLLVGLAGAAIIIPALGVATGWTEQETLTHGALAPLARVMGFLLPLGSPLFIISGLGLLRGGIWARIMALILSALSLFAFPLGTVLGIFGLWVLLRLS